MIVKDKYELETLKKAGAILAEVLYELQERVVAGVSSAELDELAHDLIIRKGAKPSFLGYKPEGHKREYPATICFSLNDEVVHGIPNEKEKILKSGDIVTLDCGLWLDDLCVDAARTLIVGSASKEAKIVHNAAKEMLSAQISAAKPGVAVSDLGQASEKVVNQYGIYTPKILGGHGVGKAVHEEPFVPSYFSKDSYFKYKLKEGQVLALEPIAIFGTSEVILDKDGYTYKSKDGSLSAQFEETVAIFENGAEIITALR